MCAELTFDILVVDDEADMREQLARTFRREGHRVTAVANGRTAIDRATTDRFDIVLLDVAMGAGADGYDVCRTLRASGNRLPVLMLTARGAVDDRVAGLDAGADDYLVKPFALDELFARLRALLRRRGAEEAETLRYADLELDVTTREVRRADAPIELTRTEFALLELFLRNPKQVLTRSVIYERVWGYDFGFGSNSLDVYIGYLRRKTEVAGRPRLIHTVRGVGYALREA